MNHNDETITVPLDHLRRCQGGKNNQCRFLAVEGSDYCKLHGGASTAVANERKSIRNYQLTKFKAELERHANSSHIKDLRDEVGLLRMMLETKLNRIQDEADLMMQSQGISELITKINAVVTSMHALDAKTNQVLDKTTLITVATRMVEVISTELEDEPDKLERVSTNITQIIQTL